MSTGGDHVIFRDVLSPKEAVFLGPVRPGSVTGRKMARPKGWEEEKQRVQQGRLTSVTRERKEHMDQRPGLEEAS